MATKRYWYLYNNNLSLVEDGHNKTIGNTTTVYDSISEADKVLRINTISLAQAFDATLGYSSELPIQFHEAILFKVIAMGYQDPRNFNGPQAQYFIGEYEKSKREAKKYAKRNNQTGGVIIPRDF
tara:strand:- start:659 stop:1033 length:375 start_codon:yes stop_codon:yes gene_type:complete